MTLGRLARHVVTAIIVIAIPAAAQEAAPQNVAWSFANLMNGFCVAFLVDSNDARSLLPDEALPVRASSVERLNPALARAIADQPEYAAWIPGQLCVYRFGRAEVNGSELVAKEGEGEAFGWVGLVARATPSASVVAFAPATDPPLAAVNVTATPATGFPPASSSFTAGAIASAEPTTPD